MTFSKVDGALERLAAMPQQMGIIPVYAQTSDGGSTNYYKLPSNATELNDLIEHKNMSFALGNIFKACYRFGEKDAASRLYDLNKIIYFAGRLKALDTKYSS